MTIDMHEISQIVCFHRKRSGLSRNRLADIAGIGKTLLYDIEHGKETVKILGLLKVLDTLNIKLLLDSPLMEDYRDQEAKIEKS